MGRPTKFNRGDAIELAMNTFWEKGFEPTSVSDLASAMSITRSSFYNSFESREAIFDEALALYQNSGSTLNFDPDNPNYNPVKSVRAFFLSVCTNLGNDPDSRGCMVINCYVQSTLDQPAPAGVHEFIDTKREQFEVITKLAQQKGVVPKDQDAGAVADALVTLLIGVNVLGKHVHEAGRLWAGANTALSSLGFGN